MKKIFLLAAFVVSLTANAQIIDTFDTNEYGWTELSGSDGEAIITDGKMHVVGKRTGTSIFSAMVGVNGIPSFIETHCYAPLDVTKDFEIRCDAYLKSVDWLTNFGLMLNYVDDGNFLLFMVSEGKACLVQFKEYRVVGRIRADIKLKSQKQTEVKFSVKSTYNKLEFFVNEMKALECRYFPLISNGVGFYVYGRQTVDFDNIEFIQ